MGAHDLLRSTCESWISRTSSVWRWCYIDNKWTTGLNAAAWQLSWCCWRRFRPHWRMFMPPAWQGWMRWAEPGPKLVHGSSQFTSVHQTAVNLADHLRHWFFFRAFTPFLHTKMRTSHKCMFITCMNKCICICIYILILWLCDYCVYKKCAHVCVSGEGAETI